MRKIYRLHILLCICVVFLFACATMSARYTIPSNHPEKMSRNQMCTECHKTQAETIVYERYEHTVYFAESHGQVARMDEPPSASRLCVARYTRLSLNCVGLG